MIRIAQVLRLYNGQPRSHSMVGGYPLIYLDSHERPLCANCAAECEDLAFVGTNESDQNYECDNCGATIECAYPADESE